MDLLEVEGKKILEHFGIAIPKGSLVRTPQDGVAAAAALGGACMVKAQVAQGGRGKAGLVRAVASAAEVAPIAANLFGIRTQPPVDSILVEQKLAIARELYLAIRVDDVLGQPLVLASAQGGVDIEEHAGDMFSHAVDVLAGLTRHEAVGLWKQVGLSGEALQGAAEFTLALWRVFWESDAALVEVNPVVIDTDGKFWAADAKVSIDDNALYRHPELGEADAARPGTALEQRGRRLGVNTYLDLDGDVAVVSSGASFGMLLLDQVIAHGGRPANFMDMGGRATGIAREKLIELAVYKAETDPAVKAMLVAFVLTSQSLKMFTNAVLGAFGNNKLPCPVVSWIGATHVSTQDMSLPEAYRLLEGIGIRCYDKLDEALAAAVEASRT